MKARGRRTQARAAQRRERNTTRMQIPDHLRELIDQLAQQKERDVRG